MRSCPMLLGTFEKIYFSDFGVEKMNVNDVMLANVVIKCMHGMEMYVFRQRQ